MTLDLAALRRHLGALKLPLAVELSVDDECGHINDADGGDMVTTDNGVYRPTSAEAEAMVALLNAAPALLDRIETLERSLYYRTRY